MASDFYNTLSPISDFEAFIDRRNFTPLPHDWDIVIADIRNSSDAITQGLYKDVNFIGGAVICAVQNATMDHEWPFVFGGDGATLLVPASERAAIEPALVRTRTMARDEFNLDLRIGFVPVRDVRKRGLDVLVARYEPSQGNYFALFGGGGAELADQLVKADENAERYTIGEYSLGGFPDLTGLSCRWEPVSAQQGRISCLLVRPRAAEFQKKQAILASFIRQLTQILGSHISHASPVTSRSLKLGWPPEGLALEAKATKGQKAYWHRWLEVTLNSIVQYTMDRFALTAGGYNAGVYRKEMQTNSDFCRFDDILRLVLDCSPNQMHLIDVLLKQMREKGEINYGSFDTEQALVTCLLFDLQSSKHVHFIDGDNGGFNVASSQLKQQITNDKVMIDLKSIHS